MAEESLWAIGTEGALTRLAALGTLSRNAGQGLQGAKRTV